MHAQSIVYIKRLRYFFMIGYCCDDDKKLLVAEYMHHDTLAKHLFNWENQTIEWAMRLRVALNIAEVLDYCSIKGRPLYHDLNSYMVLFDEMRLNQSARQNVGFTGRKKKNLQKGQLK